MQDGDRETSRMILNNVMSVANGATSLRNELVARVGRDHVYAELADEVVQTALAFEARVADDLAETSDDMPRPRTIDGSGVMTGGGAPVEGQSAIAGSISPGGAPPRGPAPAPADGPGVS